MLLMSTGVRAGYFGVLLALICYSVFQNKYNYLSFFIVASFAVNLLYKFYVGNDAPVFLHMTLMSNGSMKLQRR